MGKRSLKTTKNGKYMNPTDQARKEQRRRELKKNKKQREVVRTAIIKSKEPKRLLEEMELLDEMEYNPVQQSSLNNRVLQEKRKKLKETLDKIREMMEKDAPESIGEFRQMMANYEKRRSQHQAYFEQVKNAERVRPDQIPLPSEVPPPSSLALPSEIPLPGRPSGSGAVAVQGILKKPPTVTTIVKESGIQKVVFRPLKNIPGPPPGPPPNLSDSDDESSDEDSHSSDESVDSESPSDSSSYSGSESEDEHRQYDTSRPKKSIRFADDVPLDSGKDTRLTVNRERQQRSRGNVEEDETPYDPEQPVESEPPRPSGYSSQTGAAVMSNFAPPPFPPMIPPMQMAGRLPPFGAPNFPDAQAPRSVRRLPGGKLVIAGGPAVLQAPPTTFQRGSAVAATTGAAAMTNAASDSQQQSSLSHQMAPPPADPKITTIEKKAQLKNLLQESTKFVPPQLKVRREFKDAHGRIVKPTVPSRAAPSSASASSNQRPPGSGFSTSGSTSATAAATAKGADKDDIYAQFMKGLDGLL